MLRPIAFFKHSFSHQDHSFPQVDKRMMQTNGIWNRVGAVPERLVKKVGMDGGLYAFAIDQHSLIVTPLQVEGMLSCITNGEKIPKPQIAPQLIGKTGTAEILYEHTIDEDIPPKMEKHTWFTAISCSEDPLEEPELIVSVYLRFFLRVRKEHLYQRALCKNGEKFLLKSR